jgi:hypothetical protein
MDMLSDWVRPSDLIRLTAASPRLPRTARTANSLHVSSWPLHRRRAAGMERPLRMPFALGMPPPNSVPVRMPTSMLRMYGSVVGLRAGGSVGRGRWSWVRGRWVRVAGEGTALDEPYSAAAMHLGVGVPLEVIAEAEANIGGWSRTKRPLARTRHPPKARKPKRHIRSR